MSERDLREWFLNRLIFLKTLRKTLFQWKSFYMFGDIARLIRLIDGLIIGTSMFAKVVQLIWLIDGWISVAASMLDKMTRLICGWRNVTVIAVKANPRLLMSAYRGIILPNTFLVAVNMNWGIPPLWIGSIKRTRRVVLYRTEAWNMKEQVRIKFDVRWWRALVLAWLFVRVVFKGCGCFNFLLNYIKNNVWLSFPVDMVLSSDA